MFNNLTRRLAILILCIPAWAAKLPFTYETANHATGYMEWILDVRFTADQRQLYQEMLAEMWGGSQSSADAIGKMASAHEMLIDLDKSKQERMRGEKQPQFVRLLESASDDKSRWLLSIYQDAHRGSSAPAETLVASPQPAGRSGAPLGRWTDGYISSIQYRNSTTGVGAPTNGRTFSYEFKPDGTYSFTGLVQSVMYNCTTAMFSNETGTYSVNGDSISLRPEKNPYRMTNNCAPSSNREAPGKLIARTYRFRVSVESGRQYLELRGDDGSTQKFGSSR